MENSQRSWRTEFQRSSSAQQWTNGTTLALQITPHTPVPGDFPLILSSDNCWLRGALFLSTSEWPFPPKTSVQGLLKSPNSDTLSENVTFVLKSTVTHANVFPWEKFSSYAKVLRIMTYVMRVHPKHKRFRTMDKSLQDPGEKDIAQQKVQYLPQYESFPGICKQLLENKCISRSSPLLQYSPFVGSAGQCPAWRMVSLKPKTFLVQYGTIYGPEYGQLEIINCPEYGQPVLIKT